MDYLAGNVQLVIAIFVHKLCHEFKTISRHKNNTSNLKNHHEIYAISVFNTSFKTYYHCNSNNKIYIYFYRKDIYSDQTRKLIIELKRIGLLNRSI